MEYGMSKHRVLLVCPQQLFGESIEEILSIQADMELIETCGLDDNVHQRIIESRPDVVVLVGVDSQSDEMIRLTSAIIEQHPEVSVVRAGLTEKIIRVFSSQRLPAHSVNFLEVIRDLPVAYKT
jgi:DNA-binding NarL/FixJ family response regulator